MGLENYRDVGTGAGSLNAGFQYQFYCSHCSRKWTSPFKPYRMGQVTGFLQRFAFLVSGMSTAAKVSSGASDYSARNAQTQALEDAKEQAARYFTQCKQCDQAACEDCFDSSRHLCVSCIQGSTEAARNGESSAGGKSGHACPNCSTANSGGRFCAECGFDMASTHKSCPGCGTLTERAARFCGDCGHGF